MDACRCIHYVKFITNKGNSVSLGAPQKGTKIRSVTGEWGAWVKHNHVAGALLLPAMEWPDWSAGTCH
jgi:hypothetical protein